MLEIKTEGEDISYRASFTDDTFIVFSLFRRRKVHISDQKPTEGLDFSVTNTHAAVGSQLLFFAHFRVFYPLGYDFNLKYMAASSVGKAFSR